MSDAKFFAILRCSLLVSALVLAVIISQQYYPGFKSLENCEIAAETALEAASTLHADEILVHVLREYFHQMYSDQPLRFFANCSEESRQAAWEVELLFSRQPEWWPPLDKRLDKAVEAARAARAKMIAACCVENMWGSRKCQGFAPDTIFPESYQEDPGAWGRLRTRAEIKLREFVAETARPINCPAAQIHFVDGMNSRINEIFSKE